MFGRKPIFPALACVFLLSLPAQAVEINVSTADEVLNALGQANPGDIIRVAQGVYDFLD